ncbi:MAG: sigma 54-interacting transcriptional regulator [Gemmataceae bacterium]
MRPRLIFESGGGCASHPLSVDQITRLGRNRSNSIVLNDEHSSRCHAEIICENGQWMLRDCDTMNGTRLNDQRIAQPMPLSEGDEIRIGDTRFRFCVTEMEADTAAAALAAVNPQVVSGPDPGLARTQEHIGRETDELAALCTLLSGPVDDMTPRTIVARALAAIYQQTGAGVVGFLSLDEEDPLPKMVHPELTRVDVHLSRRLTQQVQREGKRVWLSSQAAQAEENESLLAFTDAVCVPLNAGKAPLGALHVYKSGKHFSDREVRFCEAVAGFLANGLQVLRARRQLEAENQRLRRHGPAEDEVLLGASTPMQKVRQQIARIAPRQTTVLIVGESGVGKELVALSIHRHSLRGGAPLVTVNCAAIASQLIESELFGHCKGAYTGAYGDRKGMFERADEGTLFLDEIGDLSLECQAKLLRVLEGKPFQALGGEKDIKTDVRIIAATNRDLETQVQDRGFRKDLFFRLGIPIRVPPLRDHAEDVPTLVKHFLNRLTTEYRRPIHVTESALDRLQAYNWPGNVRQLRSVLEHAVAMTDGDTVDVDDLKLSGVSSEIPPKLPSLNLEELEASAICQALTETKGNLSQAAKALGIHRDTLSTKMKKYNIEKDGL